MTNKYIEAKYNLFYRFKIPRNLNLDNLEYWIKHTILYIKLDNDVIIEIEGVKQEPILKHADTFYEVDDDE